MKTFHSTLAAISLAAVLSGCGSGDSNVAPLPMPQGNNGQSHPNMTIAQRANIENVRAGLPEDGKCRVRYVNDNIGRRFGFAVFAGKRVIHEGAYDSLFSAANMQRNAIYYGLCSEIATGTCDLEFGDRNSVERRYLPTIDGYPISERTMFSIHEAVSYKYLLEASKVCVQRVSTNCQAIYDEANYGYLVIRDGYPMGEILRSINQSQRLLRILKDKGYCAR